MIRHLSSIIQTTGLLQSNFEVLCFSIEPVCWRRCEQDKKPGSCSIPPRGLWQSHFYLYLPKRGIVIADFEKDFLTDSALLMPLYSALAFRTTRVVATPWGFNIAHCRARSRKWQNHKLYVSSLVLKHISRIDTFIFQWCKHIQSPYRLQKCFLQERHSKIVSSWVNCKNCKIVTI